MSTLIIGCPGTAALTDGGRFHVGAGGAVRAPFKKP